MNVPSHDRVQSQTDQEDEAQHNDAGEELQLGARAAELVAEPLEEERPSAAVRAPGRRFLLRRRVQPGFLLADSDQGGGHG